jgi:hypothetical protein
MEAQIAILRAGFVVQEAETLALIEQEKAQEAQLVQTRVELAMSRQADPEIVPPVEMERG